MDFSFSNYLKGKAIFDKNGISILINNGQPFNFCLDLDKKYNDRIFPIIEKDTKLSKYISNLKDGTVSFMINYDDIKFELYFKDGTFKVAGDTKNSNDCSYLKSAFSIKDFVSDFKDAI
jgi:hypothetical protein